jgi:hypothetical protein
MTSTTTQTSNSGQQRYPTRQAATQGQQQRRETAAYYSNLDSTLRQNMGSSAGHYSTTKAGTPRKEYYG